MATPGDLELALAYLVGRQDRNGPVATTSFDLTKEEVRGARRSIALMLEGERPPRSLLNALSALFWSEESMLSGNRSLIIGKRRKGPARDWAKDLDVVILIKLKWLNGASVEDAIGDTAAEIGMTDSGVRDIWRRNKPLRDRVLTSLRRRQ